MLGEADIDYYRLPPWFFLLDMTIKSPDIPVVVFVAGNNNPSNSEYLADEFIAGMRDTDRIHAQKVRVADLSLDHFSLKFYESGADQGEDFRRIHGMIDKAKGIVIATPIWNFSVPAHLKNLIDRIGSFGLDPATRTKGMLGGKPVFLIFTGGAGNFAWQSLMNETVSHVRESMKYFGLTVLETHFEPKCVTGDRTFGLVVDKRPEVLAAMKQKGKTFGEIVATFAETGKLPASVEAKSKFYKVASWFAKKFT
jgi:NAD(P)H-dependent FMN reductase